MQHHHHQYLNRSFEQDNPLFVPTAAPTTNSRLLGVVSATDVGAGGADASILMASSHNAGVTVASNVKDIAVGGHRTNVDDSDLNCGTYATNNVYRKGHR